MKGLIQLLALVILLVKFFDDVTPEGATLFQLKLTDLLSTGDLLLLEDFELRQLNDYVRNKRAKGKAFVSRVTNFKPDQVDFDSSETVELGNMGANQDSADNRQSDKEPEPLGQRVPASSIIMPAGWQRHLAKENRSNNLPARPERPTVMKEGQGTIIFDVGNPFATTSTSVRGLSNIETANDQLESDQSNDEKEVEEKMASILNNKSNIEPSAEDYEKLAKILQEFVNRRKWQPRPTLPTENQNEFYTRENLTKPLPNKGEPASKGLSPIPASYSTMEKTIELPSSGRGITLLSSSGPSWQGTVEKADSIPLLKETIMSTTTPIAQLLGRVHIQPSKLSTYSPPTSDEETNSTMVSLTSDRKAAASDQQEDLEWKIREISRELSSVLHKLKKEKELGGDSTLPKSSYSLKGPTIYTANGSITAALPPPPKTAMNKRVVSKAYVTLLREGLARQIDTNQYIFVASLTLIRDDAKVILVDTGMATDINGRTDLLRKLSKLNIAPPRVDYVVTSHGHADHSGNTNDFPDAVHFQGSVSHQRTRFNFSDLFENDQFHLTPNVWLVKTPGHTSEDISVLVRNTDKYGTMAVAGDVFIAAEDMWRPLAWNDSVQEESRRKLLCMADWIVPGHGKAFRVTGTMRARVPKCPEQRI